MKKISLKDANTILSAAIYSLLFEYSNEKAEGSIGLGLVFKVEIDTNKNKKWYIKMCDYGNGFETSVIPLSKNNNLYKEKNGTIILLYKDNADVVTKATLFNCNMTSDVDDDGTDANDDSEIDIDDLI